MPWKNGQGSTTEVAVEPEGAGLDAFTWRISIADIAGSGPFSIFPGIERILVQTEGEPMVLVHDERESNRHPLTRHVPYRFAGEWPTVGEVPAPPVRDFNVMARRDRVRASMTVHELRRGSVVRTSVAATTQVVHAFRGTLTVQTGMTATRAAWQLGAGETLIVTANKDGTPGVGAELALEIAAEMGDAVAFFITFS